MNYPYEYFSGANVQINVSDVSATDIKTMIECAGITFNVSESNQPVYGYASNLYGVQGEVQDFIQLDVNGNMSRR